MSHWIIPASLMTLGSDTGKTTCHMIGLDKRGEIVLARRFHGPESAPGLQIFLHV